ncbi:hypothetical protein EXIGLDRAFT_831222 [Exidia glandulosa HHB12029]|uniref:C2H2-type domain-containing protein n=1 Tax=Exidia glandulosa HHB12029 TaxID=1314781 RepID=A0A165MWD7_EXIGL|nr:hypothetical protein EXIGLDRAFT_831222 [Exidia glandulosa HHB12029]
MKLVKTFSGGDLLFESPSASPVIEQRALLSEEAFSFPDPYAMPSVTGPAIDYSAPHALQQIPQPVSDASYSEPAPLWYNFEFDFNSGVPCEDAWPVANLNFDPYSTPQMIEPAHPLSRELSCIDPSTLSAPALALADQGFLAPVDFFHSVLQDEQPPASTKRRQSFDEDDNEDVCSAPRFRAASYRKMPKLQKTAKSSSSSEEFDLDSDSDRPHACADCGLRFRRDAERARHALVHLPAAQQAVTCGVCGRAVRGGRKDAMRRHQLRTALCVKVQDRYTDEELKSLGCVTRAERAAWKLKTAK